MNCRPHPYQGCALPTELHGHKFKKKRETRVELATTCLEGKGSTTELFPQKWWTGKDSNLRRHCQQIYSLLPLTTWVPVHLTAFLLYVQFEIFKLQFKADDPDRTDDLLITNQLLYQLSYVGTPERYFMRISTGVNWFHYFSWVKISYPIIPNATETFREFVFSEIGIRTR